MGSCLSFNCGEKVPHGDGVSSNPPIITNTTEVDNDCVYCCPISITKLSDSSKSATQDNLIICCGIVSYLQENEYVDEGAQVEIISGGMCCNLFSFKQLNIINKNLTTLTLGAVRGIFACTCLSKDDGDGKIYGTGCQVCCIGPFVSKGWCNFHFCCCEAICSSNVTMEHRSLL